MQFSFPDLSLGANPLFGIKILSFDILFAEDEMEDPDGFFLSMLRRYF